MTTVLTERAGGVLIATLNRPDVLNAFDREMTDQLARVVEAAESDPEVSVLVITGTGRAFSSGYDLSPQPGWEPGFYGTSHLLRLLTLFPKPVLLGINGLGIGLGATLTSLADVVVMADSARLRCPFVNLGLTPEAGSTFQFARLMGPQRAAWFLLSGEWMSARQCVEARLAMEAVPDDQLRDRVLAMAAALASQPLDSLVETKRLLTAPHQAQLIASIRAENETVTRMKGGAASQEAVAAFRAGRPPDFSSASLARYAHAVGGSAGPAADDGPGAAQSPPDTPRNQRDTASRGAQDAS